MTEPRSSSDRRILAVILSLVAAGAFAYACISTQWLYNPRNKDHFEVGFGLRSNFECEPEGECRSMSNRKLIDQWQDELAEIKERARKDDNLGEQAFAMAAQDQLRAPGSFPILGWITLVCIGIAAVSLVVSAGLTLAKKRILWPIMPTTTAILGIAVGLVTGCVFVAMKPGPAGYVGVGIGFWAFGAGVVSGLAGALMINKHLRPHDPDLLADSMNPDDI